MSHLRGIFRLYFYHSIPTFFLGLLTTILLLLALSGERIEERLAQWMGSSREGDYFHALVEEKVSLSTVVRKLLDLPGVVKVQILTQDQIQSRVAQVGKLVFAEETSSLNLNFQGLKVIFSKNLSRPSQELVQGYLKRLLIDTELTLGPLVQNNQAHAYEEFRGHFLSWSVPVLFIFCTLLWGGAYLVWILKVRKTSFLITRYLRVKHLPLKAFLLLLAVVSALVSGVHLQVILAWSFYSTLVVGLFLLFTTLTVLLGRSQWDS